jgi:ATP-dependent DNA ligase
VVGGYTMGGNPFDALIVGCYDGRNLKYVAKVRAGFVSHIRAAMFPLLQKLTTDNCPFADLPEKRRTLYSLTRDEMQNCQWLKPLVVAQIEFAEWTPDGHLRHASLSDCEAIKRQARFDENNGFQSCFNPSLNRVILTNDFLAARTCSPFRKTAARLTTTS